MKAKLLPFAAGMAAACISVIASQAWASTYQLKKGPVQMEVPSDWQDVSNLFGMPLMFLGPAKGGGRPVISVTPTGIEGLKFDAESLKKNQTEYREGRKAWIAKHNGSVVSFLPYHTEKWGTDAEAHVVGYRYRLQDAEFTESSYYVSCKGQLYHLKTLVRADHETTYSDAVEKMVRSFKCEQ